MCEKSGIFNSKSVPTYRTRTITKKAYRTSAPYFFAKIEAYRTAPTYRTVLPSLTSSSFYAYFVHVLRCSEQVFQPKFNLNRSNIELIFAKSSRNFFRFFSETPSRITNFNSSPIPPFLLKTFH